MKLKTGATLYLGQINSEELPNSSQSIIRLFPGTLVYVGSKYIGIHGTGIKLKIPKSQIISFYLRFIDDSPIESH